MSISVGFAKADITPKQATGFSGFASRTELATGTLDPLNVRVIALDDGRRRVALAAFDLIGVPDGLIRSVAALLDAPDLTLLPLATHTHAGPPVLVPSLLGKVPEGYLAALARMTAEAVRAAFTGIGPARVSHRKVSVPGIAHNRRDPHGPVDHHADVAGFHGPDGGLIALWLNFACHPVVLGPDNLRYSADFPGVARRLLEERFGVPVLYTTGCCGQINLGHSALDSIRKVGLDKRTPAEAERIGKLLGTAVAEDLERESPVGDDVAALAYAETKMPALYERVDAAARERFASDARRVLADPAATPGERAMAEIDIAWLARRHEPAELTVGAFGLGPLDCAFLPGEIFIETALALQAAVPGALVAGYAYSNPGYIPHESAAGGGGYEVDVAWRPYGAPGPFVPDMAARLEAEALQLLRSVRAA